MSPTLIVTHILASDFGIIINIELTRMWQIGLLRHCVRFSGICVEEIKNQQRHSGRIIRVATGNWTGVLPNLSQLRKGLRQNFWLQNLICFFVRCHFDHKSILPDKIFFPFFDFTEAKMLEIHKAINGTRFSSKKSRLKRALINLLSRRLSQLWKGYYTFVAYTKLDLHRSSRLLLVLTIQFHLRHILYILSIKEMNC
jgi:hypothetical protein